MDKDAFWARWELLLSAYTMAVALRDDELARFRRAESFARNDKLDKLKGMARDMALERLEHADQIVIARKYDLENFVAVEVGHHSDWLETVNPEVSHAAA